MFFLFLILKAIYKARNNINRNKDEIIFGLKSGIIFLLDNNIIKIFIIYDTPSGLGDDFYRLDNSNDINDFKFNNKYYKLYCLNEENRIKTTHTLEELIGELPNVIMTSVLLQGNYGTFKSKDNKGKK